MNERNKPYIISICSGKGGVGKSVLAANIASELANSGKTLIWDGDMYFPNQHLLLGVEPPVRLRDVYNGNIDVDTAVFKVKPNLYLLADLPATGNEIITGPTELISTRNQLIDNSDFNFIIIDTPAGASDNIITLCQIADQVNIVITDEPTSLLDAYGLTKVIIQMINTDNIRLLVNNVIDNEDANEINEKLNLATEKFLGLKLDFQGFVPYGRIVRQSILYQKLFCESDPNDEVSEAVRKIALKIANEVRTVTAGY